MERMMSCKEAADIWNFTERWVSIMCKEGKIPGAVKQGHRWMIPSGTPRPVDSRVKTGAYKKEGSRSALPPALGVTSYIKAVTGYYYVDKTLMIKEFLDNRPQVSLFLRPRHFGKTLTLDMMRVFFEKTGTDTSRYFLSKSIWSCGESYRRQQGAYPVISLGFSVLRFSTWEETQASLNDLIRNEYLRHPELSDSGLIPAADKNLYHEISENRASVQQSQTALFSLCRMLHMHHGTAPVVLIDDYDTPFLSALENGYEKELLYCFQCMLTPVFRDNPHLSFGIMSGVQGVPEKYASHDLPEPAVFGVTGKQFSSAFGFTEEEGMRLCAYYNMAVRFDEINEWYGGYNFSGSVLLNPLSVLKCISNEGRIQTYQNLSGNRILFESFFGFASSGSMEHLQMLLQDRIVKAQAELEAQGELIPQSLRTCYGCLVKEGYLNIIMQRLRPNGVTVYEMLIPNLETLAEFKKQFTNYLSEKKIMAPGPAAMIQEALYSKNAVRFQSALKQLLYQSIKSNGNPADEYYQTLLTGLMVLTEGYYTVDIESDAKGDNYNIRLTPEADFLHGVRIEIIAGKTVKLLYSR
ncbi:MAG: AAA family ATPase [Lachnospiraceae bacterium]|nr:AAA family ATPase [Lachnospiraceae bacterium]